MTGKAGKNTGVKQRLIKAGLLGGVAWIALDYTGPLLSGHEINPLTLVLALGLAGAGLTVFKTFFRYLSEFFEKLDARTPRGIKGTAKLITKRRDLKHALDEKNPGLYVGTMQGRELVVPIQVGAFICAPSGSGKNLCIYQMNALMLRGISKTLIDFRSDQTPVLLNALKEQGETVYILNLSGLYRNIVGEGDEYNVLNLVADAYTKDEGLLDIVDLVVELALQLYEEKGGESAGGGGNDNLYFRDGSREIIVCAIQICVLVDGYNATLADVLHLIQDRKSFLFHTRWIADRVTEPDPDDKKKQRPVRFPWHELPWVERHSDEDIANYGTYLRSLAGSIANLLSSSDSRGYDSFERGAIQALQPFHIASRSHKKTKRSTFRFSEQKEDGKAVTVCIMLDPNRIEAQKKVMGIVQWGMLYEIKQHKNKHKPVYLLADELANIPWNNLGGMISWSRAYGLRCVFFFQNMEMLAHAKGQHVVDALLSECEVQLYLAGQNNPKTLSVIENLIAKTSIVVKGTKGSKGAGFFGIDGFDFKEDELPLMTADQIRTSKKAILLIAGNHAALVDTPPIAAARPFRTQIDINPFFGKALLLKVRLWVIRFEKNPIKKFCGFLFRLFVRR